MDTGRYQVYWGWDLVLNKRLSHKWMINGSVTYQMQNGTTTAPRATLDPTGCGRMKARSTASRLGGTSGKISVNMFTRWMFKLSASISSPGMSTSRPRCPRMKARSSAKASASKTAPCPTRSAKATPCRRSPTTTATGSPNVWTINVKVEKMIKLGDTGRMYFSADIFNVLNSHPILRQYENSLGTFRFVGNGSTDVNLRTAPAATAVLQRDDEPAPSQARHEVPTLTQTQN